MNIPEKDINTLRLVGEAADSLGLEAYAVGGYVRDCLLQRPSKDIDFVTVGSGIELAKAVARKLGRGAHLSVFKNFGTARVNSRDLELEFVGARRESYSHDSRKPVVEDGTLVDDISRRDFTVNALALRVNAEGFGEVVDLFNGLADMERRVLRTPLDPDVTFSDDPLRMMRAVRFATQLRFAIDGNTYEGICRNASRLEIISRERIAEELNKIMKAPKPSIGWRLLLETGLLHYILPELEEMQKVDVVNGRAHKDNFDHTMKVLDKVAEKTDDLWLRWSALLHDIAKPRTKRWDPKIGWTFHNHNFVGAKMVPSIFRDLRLPLGEPMKFVQTMVELHMRPIVLSEEIVTDSAVRRLLFDAGDNIDSLMTLCEADITTGRPEKLKKCLDNFALVRRKLVELEERDRIRNFQPPITGNDIMTIFNIPPSKPIKELKEAIKDAILDGQIPNDRLAAYEFMLPIAEKIGLTKVNDLPDVCIESQKD
ncbi:MAG: CCA tRNA nucleotidyltransferase [Muribaculaceae bacterium]|nr:HD domain-containing protein [Bacteroides sp.]MBD5326292.1 HD domain-containing protein [Bacteroides sp.]MBD5328125.1 HD domain-containing protein [Bacteroides sp.]MDE6223436.1 CCA tRNA nucleotidyltransferase [Muribaculaceae bacterium]MDE6229801.1 CCA tRNA nucleotidyltransferase [Muribaculaceae bacterium]